MTQRLLIQEVLFGKLVGPSAHLVVLESHFLVVMPFLELSLAHLLYRFHYASVVASPGGCIKDFFLRL